MRGAYAEHRILLSALIINPASLARERRRDISEGYGDVPSSQVSNREINDMRVMDA